MNSIEILDCLKDFLKKNVVNTIKLKKPPENGNLDEEYTLISPEVYEAYVPLKNMDDYNGNVPALLVMIDDGTDDNDACSVNVRIKIATYNPGKRLENGKQEISVEGYRDLLNVIELIRIKLFSTGVINEKIIINKPIKWQMDKEQKMYPYWFADITFNVQLDGYKRNLEQYL